jgi:hypothetical protein
MNRLLLIFTAAFCPFLFAISQNTGQFSGSLQSTSHYYLRDRILSPVKPLNPIASNNYFLVHYNNGPFSAGIQYEAYMPPLSGYPYQLEGNRVTHRYFSFTKEIIDLTVGNFYEQFGNGLIFRAYESRELGINNSLDGVRVVIRPISFLRVTGVYGKQKKYLDTGNSFLRGLDAELNIDTLLHSSMGLKLGAGLLSRYEPYTGAITDFPSTVNAASLRVSLNRNNLEINSEYAFKSDDPNLKNLYSYAHGSAILLNGSFTGNRSGIFLSIRFLNNMDFRSERDSEGNYLMVNYLPSNTRQHSYLLTNIYPYTTQSAGEMAIQGEINYSFSRGSFAGGKYGTGIRMNFSQSRNLRVNENTGSNRLISAGNKIYFQDINTEISKKWSPKVKSIFTYIYLLYDKGLIEGPGYDFVRSHILISDLQYRITSYFSLRTELQHLWTRQDHGNWVAALAEFGYAPHWSLFVSDMIDYQYNNKIHYTNTGIGYSIDYLRISFGYGRQREGQICAGGICQRVPSYKGFNLKLNVHF